MKKSLFFLLAFLSIIYVNAQVCESPEKSPLDLNSISITKCSVKPAKNPKKGPARQIFVKISAPKKRFLRRKNVASSANGLGASGVTEITEDSAMAHSLQLKNSIANLTNTLSHTEVRMSKRFTEVDKIPTFDTCKGTVGNKRLDCFNTEMVKHIQKHFRYPSEAIVKKIQGDVWVRFVIDKNGNVTNIKTLVPENGELLNYEAKRVVSKLPKFVPGSIKGKNVSVKYGFPINFSLE